MIWRDIYNLLLENQALLDQDVTLCINEDGTRLHIDDVYIKIDDEDQEYLELILEKL